MDNAPSRKENIWRKIGRFLDETKSLDVPEIIKTEKSFVQNTKTRSKKESGGEEEQDNPSTLVEICDRRKILLGTMNRHNSIWYYSFTRRNSQQTKFTTKNKIQIRQVFLKFCRSLLKCIQLLMSSSHNSGRADAYI